MFFKLQSIGFLLLGIFIQTTVQLSCLRCSSTVEPIDQEKSESCFHGTVKPKKCDDSEARNSTNLSCFTLVFRHSKSLKGILVTRGCGYDLNNTHDCTLERSEKLSEKKTLSCRVTCIDDGCNTGSAEQFFFDVNVANESVKHNQTLKFMYLFFMSIFITILK